MSLRKQARILGIAPSYLSMLVNGKRKSPDELRHRYEELVNSVVNTTAGTGETEEERNESSVPEKRAGGAEGIRTPDLLIANETRYQLRHSPRYCSMLLVLPCARGRGGTR